MQEDLGTSKEEKTADIGKPAGTEVQEKDAPLRGEPEPSPTAQPVHAEGVKEQIEGEKPTAPEGATVQEVGPVKEPETTAQIVEEKGEKGLLEERQHSPSKAPAFTDPVQTVQPLAKELSTAKPTLVTSLPQSSPAAPPPDQIATLASPSKPASAPGDGAPKAESATAPPTAEFTARPQPDEPGQSPATVQPESEAIKPQAEKAAELKPEAATVAAQDPKPQAPAEAVKEATLPETSEQLSDAVKALEQKVKEATAEAENAGQVAAQAVVQAAQMARASAVPYEPPMPVPPHVLAQGPPPVDAAKLEAQAAAASADIARRAQAAEAYKAKVEQEEKQGLPERPTGPSDSRERSGSPQQERAMPPRRAASARAAQVFKKDADDYLSDSPADSPPDSPAQKKTPPKPKPQAPPAAKPAQSKDSGASAWEEPPQKQQLLKPGDVNKGLQKKWLQLYWPDDGKWWPCQVVFVDPRKKTANVLYETGEEEADLGLAELIDKGEVAWLNASDANKEVDQPKSKYRDDFDEPGTSKGRGAGRKTYDEDDDDEEDAWTPGRKRRAAAKNAKFEESEAESSESESPPPSDQSSDWHSSEDDDKPVKKRPKKKRRPVKPPPRMPQPSHHHHHSSQSRDRPGDSGMGGRNVMNRTIFDDAPGYGGSFGGGGSDAMRSQVQARNPGMGREQMQGWGGMGGVPKTQPQFPGSWSNRSSQGLDHLMQQQQRSQQMNNGNLGQLHIPQAAMAQGMRGAPQMGWRPQQGGDMRGDWASMQANPLFRLQQQMGHAGGQMGQQTAANPALNLGGHSLPQLMQQQMLQQQHMQQRLAQQQSQQQQQAPQGGDAAGQRPVGSLGSSTKNMEGIVAQGLQVSGKTVEVQQANGQWARGTIMATMSRGPQGGSALVHFDNGDQKQLSVNDEGRTYNIRVVN